MKNIDTINNIKELHKQMRSMSATATELTDELMSNPSSKAFNNDTLSKAFKDYTLSLSFETVVCIYIKHRNIDGCIWARFAVIDDKAHCIDAGPFESEIEEMTIALNEWLAWEA